MRRLDVEQERSLALRIKEEEDKTRCAIEGTPVEPMLHEGRTLRERTRGKAVERLGRAVEALGTLSRTKLDLDAAADFARKHWRRSVQLRWQLARSARDVARREARKMDAPGLDREDLVQEGQVGLLNAARRFEPDAGVRFGTYARWWVRAEMQEAVSSSKAIRLPVSAMRTLRRLRAAMDPSTDGGARSVTEAARASEVDLDRARFLLGLLQPESLTEASADGTSVVDLVDTHTSRPDEQAELWEDLERLRQAMDATLDDRGRNILRRRYGFDGAERETLSRLAEDYGVTPQRIWQLQARAEGRIARWCAEN